MGEVWRARDSRLDRNVAVKVLLGEYATDPQLKARFEREARAIAQLNHPNICTLHDVGDGYLVMELIDGESLTAWIARGPLQITEVLRYGAQVASALDRAHRAGIVHRDLKPGNVMIAKSGVKLLDFGLARLTAPAPAAINATTASNPLTAEGTIIGTLQYMSPEQLQGKPTDARTDIFSLGCLLYEMLTGRRAFDGSNRASIISAIMTAEPRPVSIVQPLTMPALEHLIWKCLAKDPEERWQSALDVASELRWLAERRAEEAPSDAGDWMPAIRRWRIVALASAVIAVASISAALWVARTAGSVNRAGPPSSLMLPSRFAIVPPAGQPMGYPHLERNLDISSDGRHVVYRAGFGSGGGQLAVRDIDQLNARLLEGISGARDPFFSPDGRWIGFFDGDELKRVSIQGGPATTICKKEGPSGGGSWDGDNTIVFGTSELATGLFRVSASGDGKPTVLTTPDSGKSEGDHLYPAVLPDGRGVLFTITAAQPENAQVAVLDLKSGGRKTLIRGGSDARYVDLSTASIRLEWPKSGQAGYLLYASAGALRAVGFDLAKLEVVGDPVLVVDDVVVNGPGAADFAVSRSGTLVYAPGWSDPQRAPRSLVWVDRKGHEEPTKAPLHAYGAPRLSPDGTRIAVDIKDRQSDIWIWDLARETLMRLTLDRASYPIWTADGRSVVFKSLAGGASQNLLALAADGSGTVDQLTARPNGQVASSVTPDGTSLVGYEFSNQTARDITLVRLTNLAHRPGTGLFSGATSSEFQTLLQTPFDEFNGEISPDGHYLAYQSNESGRYEIYVRPFPQVNGRRWQISARGGTRPAWARTGRELFYLDEEDLLTALPVRTSGPEFTAGNPVRVLDTKYATPQVRRTYDVSADGQRFLMMKESATGDPNTTPARMIVVLNWFEELKERVSKE